MHILDKWIIWMKTCISTATANVLVNGSVFGEFKLERGIRQGDTLSPFLFLIAVGGVQPAVVGRQGLRVSHIHSIWG